MDLAAVGLMPFMSSLAGCTAPDSSASHLSADFSCFPLVFSSSNKRSHRPHSCNLCLRLACWLYLLAKAANGCNGRETWDVLVKMLEIRETCRASALFIALCCCTVLSVVAWRKQVWPSGVEPTPQLAWMDFGISSFLERTVNRPFWTSRPVRSVVSSTLQVDRCLGRRC